MLHPKTRLPSRLTNALGLPPRLSTPLLLKIHVTSAKCHQSRRPSLLKPLASQRACRSPQGLTSETVSSPSSGCGERRRGGRLCHVLHGIFPPVASVALPGIDEDTSELEFEALSKDKAWYDVDTFLSHRYVASGELEVRVKYVGFGAEEAEWVNAKDSVRLRSVALDSSECYKVEAGDHVVCFKETEDKAGYYDANVIDVERRLHDIRGCRCLFSIRYDHDNTEEKVRLRRLCCRPEMLGDEEE